MWAGLVDSRYIWNRDMNSFGIGITHYFAYYFVLESEKINSNLSWHSQKNDISASSINSVQFLFSLSTPTLGSTEYSWITVFLAKQMYLCNTPGFRLSSVHYSSYIFRRNHLIIKLSSPRTLRICVFYSNYILGGVWMQCNI